MSDYDRETGEVAEYRPQPPAREQTGARNLIFASEQCDQIFGALAVAQGDTKAPKRTKTAKVKGRTKAGNEFDYEYKYAPLEEIIDAVRGPLAKAKLVHRQFLAIRDGQHVMRTIIGHESGQWFGSDYPIFWDQARGMQGFASGVTYARRYGLMLALGISAEDDDDANVADGQPATIADGRSANGAAPAPAATTRRSPPPKQAAAVATPEKEESVKQHNILYKAIDAEMTVPGLQQLLASDDWRRWHQLAIEAEGEAIAGRVEAKLRQRATDRIAMLEEDAGRYGGMG